MDQSTKSYNTSGGKNRLRFASSKSRAKKATADVYRTSDSRLSSSATGVREKRVHDTSFVGDGKAKKKRRKKNRDKKRGDEEVQEEEEEEEVRYFGRDNDSEGLGIGRTAVIVPAKSKLQLETPEDKDGDYNQLLGDTEMKIDAADAEDEDEETEALITGGTIFYTELEISASRNGSLLYQKLVRELRPVCKSIAELLHHVERIVDLLFAYLLSPRSNGGDGDDKNVDDRSVPTPCRAAGETWKAYKKRLNTLASSGYTVNVATNDVLHLFGVLARELRDEIYPYLTTRILPRIVDDMLSPPPQPATSPNNGQVTVLILDVGHIESAFRAVGYLFKYTAEQLIHNQPPLQKQAQLENDKVQKTKKQVGDADVLRQYYGKTLCHKRDVVRRLACEAYAPILRKCVDKGLKRHLSRTVRALAGSLAAASSQESVQNGADDDDTKEEGGDEVSNMTHSAKRARSDAIDGVSSLLFEISRGAPGRVHSKKGRLVIKTLLDSLLAFTDTSKNGGKGRGQEAVLSERNKARAVYEVTSQYLYKLRGHVVRGRGSQDEADDMAGNAFVDVLDEMHRGLNAVIGLTKQAASSSDDHDAPSIIVECVSGLVIDLMTETIIFQDGRLIKSGGGDGRGIERIANSLQALLDREIYPKAGQTLQNQILQYLCSAWKAYPTQPSFALRLGKFFPSIVTPSMSHAPSSENGLDPALFLARNLLPFLPKKVASSYLIPALLGAVASSPSSTSDGGKDADPALVLLHTIATAVWTNKGVTNSTDVDIDDYIADALFTCDGAESCSELPSKVRNSLFDICLASDLDELWSKEKRKSKKTNSQSSRDEQLARVGYVARCIPFLVCLECSGGGNDDDDDSEEEDEVDDSMTDNSHSEQVLNRVFKWYSSVLKTLGAMEETFVVQSLVLESFSKSALECNQRISSNKITPLMKKALSKAKASANSLLFSHPKSFWVVRGVAAITRALSAIDPGSKLNDQSNETFELLVPNLSQENHFLRLYTLQILDGYPARPFVTDHADLDLTDDLEEEPSHQPRQENDDEGGKLNADGSSVPTLLSGACDVISLLRHLETTPVALPNERKLTSQLDRIEVYARTGKLPIVYAEAVASHMLGLLHVKFSPIWPAAVKVIVSLSLAQEGPAWPYIELVLKQSMEKSAADNVVQQDSLAKNSTESRHTNAILHHHSLCVAWELTEGKTIRIFGPQNHERIAQVSRHVVTDELTLFESVWSIMKDGPHLTSTKSKVVVPMFFEFLTAQYYVFHQDEPDSREIDLTHLVDGHPTWQKTELTRKSLQKKLECFLQMFAAVKGPQQLVKHKILLQIFVSFLANPDAKISNLSFACVLRFKLPYLTPYVEYVQPMLKKEGLREALTKFDLSKDGELVDAEHRLLLLPLLTRILFMRFSSRGNGAKSSKDSPAARRAAILSFFSGIGNDDGELNYFIYMMVRSFIPRDVSMMNDGVLIGNERLTTLIEASEKITASELRAIPAKRQEGFLNLLSDVITQIGFGAKCFVPTFMHLLLAISEQSENALVASIKNQEVLKNERVDDEAEIQHDGNARIGKIRSLAFLRLSGILTKFAASVDFSVHGNRLWKTMTSSLIALPNTVINAENPPSLLQLIETISSHGKLIPLLQQSEDVVVAVFKCIAGTTRIKVMNTVLRIIDGLLTDTNESSLGGPPVGQTLILLNIHLLIAQFNNRLTKESQIASLDEDVETFRNQSKKSHRQPSPTEGLQLNILCRVSELLASAEDTDEEDVGTIESLCNLLVPLLKFDSHPNQLYLIRTVNSLIPKISTAEAAMSHFHTLSKLLGPSKNRAGISSLEHRQVISSAIGAICLKLGESDSPKWKLVAQSIEDLHAVSRSYVDEHDFERILPVLNRLGASGDAEGSWLSMVDTENASEASKQTIGTRIMLPLIYTCFNMLYDSDGVISRASNKALKTLVSTSSELASSAKDNEQNNPWLKLMETTFVHSLKVGIATKEIATRRIFVLLVAHVARHFTGCNSVHLFGDLRRLIRDDDQEVDFFLNVTHVQLHRRARAFTRLRKLLSSQESNSSDEGPLFSDQSFANILLPLAIHPVYECKSKVEEAYVIEAIATVGEISKHLPWSKYNNTLQSALNNLERYPDQERFLIAMLCAIIDAFHFSVETGDGSSGVRANGVWRSLTNRIIPKVESFLIKEKVDNRGSRVKSLRSSVALALMKLFQKLPLDTFESKLPKLITVVCNALKNKASNDRDIARETLSKMAVGLDLKYLPLILSEMSIQLSGGYKLHVRSATLHSILVAISKVYQQPRLESSDAAALLPFDRSVPAMLDLIHQDIFGKASEIKEVQHVEKRLIKEAMGAKSLDSLEIISRLVCFRPSLASMTGGKERLPRFTNASVVHAVVTPLLERLRDPEVLASTMRKVKECLSRVAIGFSNNSTTKYDEVLPFVYASVAPFVYGSTYSIVDEDADLENSDDEVETPIQVSSSKSSRAAVSKKSKREQQSTVAVVTWAPSNLGTAVDQRSALDMKKKQKKALHRVTDGAAAPKLTGSSRHSPLKTSKAKTLNKPANAAAVSFGLTLLNSSLKRSKLDVSDDKLCDMADPYLSLLTHCVGFSSDGQAVILSLRCLGVFLRMDLPSVARSAKDLGPSILSHLTSASAASNTQSDVVQSCFKTLTLLISHPKFSRTKDESSKEEALPLTSDQMQALLSLLHSAVREYDHHNSTFGLVKAIASKRYMSTEFYDLMDIILKLSVQSQKATIRLQSSQIFLQYLIEYPMGKQRMDSHLHQIVLNIKYEYEEGRLSAVALLSSVIQKFPLPVLEEHCQFLFLPLVLQLVNDDSKKCKEAVAECVSLLLKRLSTESVQSLFGYVKRWSQSSGADSLPMQTASAQLLGLFVDSRPDYIKRGGNASDVISIVKDVMMRQDPDNVAEWELLYHNLVCTEKLNKLLPTLLSVELWGAIVNFMAYPHPWVIQISSRIVGSHLSAVDPNQLLQNEPESFVAEIPGCLFKVASNSCRQLDVEDDRFVESTSTLAIKTITWAFRAMKKHPDLCYSNAIEMNNDGSSEDEDNVTEEKVKDPTRWLMTRLSNIAKPKGVHRRESVFKCFAALATTCNPNHLHPYLELMINPIDRAIREANNLKAWENTQDDSHVALPKDVLQILEDTCGTEPFLKAYAEVNRKAREKRDKRKQDLASEAVHDPAAAAKRKLQKQVREKDRRKRRVQDRRSMRGATKKRRSN